MPVAAWQSQLLDRVMTGERFYVHDPGRRRGGRGVVTMTPDQVRVRMDYGGPGTAYSISEQVIKDSDVFPKQHPNCRSTMALDDKTVRQQADRVSRAIEEHLVTHLKHGVRILGA